jgi:hypothetical protein
LNVIDLCGPDAAAVGWLLESDEPAVRLLARREILGQDATADQERVLTGPKVRRLLDGQHDDGGFGVSPYSKWTGAHWRVVSLVELGVPAGHERVRAAAGTVLDWLTGDRHRGQVQTINGRVRAHASQEGNALAVACRLGLAADPRVRQLAGSLLEWQWPDGGWNCDVRSRGSRSSFHESLIPIWGLHEYAAATGNRAARCAARRGAELILEHRLFRSLRTGRPIHPTWTALHYPPYWHYDILQALMVLSRMGLADDPRASDALDVLQRRRLSDGRWLVDGVWWRSPGSGRGHCEVVDWGSDGPNEMITLTALRCLHAAGRFSNPTTTAHSARISG